MEDPVGTEMNTAILFVCFYDLLTIGNFKEKYLFIPCDLNYDIIHALMIQIIDEMESFLLSIISFDSSLFSTMNNYICNRLESFYETIFHTYQYFG